MYQAFIVKIEKLEPHPNADRLQLATIFGEITCVSLDTKVGDLGIYFPGDGQLSEEYCDQNHMCRKKADGSPDTGYLERESRRVKTIRLRGEPSNGVFCPITSLAYTGVDVESLEPGFAFTAINGHEICNKYIPPYKGGHTRSAGPKNKTTKRAMAAVAPLFREHVDTEQLVYNMNAFKPGDLIEITLKMHGTSQRTGYLPVLKNYKAKRLVDKYYLKKYLNAPFIKSKRALKNYNRAVKRATPIYDYDYITGTRRTVLDSWSGGFYGSNTFREQHAKIFEGKLWDGETVYYEVVGFTDTGTPIMGSCANKKIQDKAFTQQYGDMTVFSYGCSSEDDALPQSDFYVYRMTMTTTDGNVIEYTPDFMRYRCEQMGVKCVPVFFKGYIPNHPGASWDPTITAGEWVQEKAEQFYDGPDPIGKTHVREGVVVRLVNKPTFKAYKHKNLSFKILEGLVKDEATAPDMEEAQELDQNIDN